VSGEQKAVSSLKENLLTAHRLLLTVPLKSHLPLTLLGLLCALGGLAIEPVQPVSERQHKIPGKTVNPGVRDRIGTKCPGQTLVLLQDIKAGKLDETVLLLKYGLLQRGIQQSKIGVKTLVKTYINIMRYIVPEDPPARKVGTTIRYQPPGLGEIVCFVIHR
jgi:hypothetical protein